MSIWFKSFTQIVFILLIVLVFSGCQQTAETPSSDVQNQQNNLPPLTISNTNPLSYTWSTLEVNGTLYVDRDYTYTSIPANYQGLKVLKTANDDKTSTSDSSITFDISQDAYVYVAHFSPDVAQWLDSWTYTGDYLETTAHTLTVYKNYFPAGTVVLGGNNGQNSSSMYIVFVDEYAGEDAPPQQNTGTATLSWLPPAADDLAGYKIYYGNTLGNYPFTIDIPNPGITTYLIENLAPDTYYFVVTAYDDSNNESVPSDAASKTISIQ
jgi:hypothetical protein